VTDLSYNLSFTAASLRPDLARVIAENFVRLGDWEEAKHDTLATNALQTRARSTGIRIERELRQRLQYLTRDQLELLAAGSSDERAAMTWLAMLKCNAFVFEFASELLRDKLATRDATLRPSDYEAFVGAKTAAHPELQELKETSRVKIRNVLLRMLVEVGILVEGDSLGIVQRVPLSPTVLRVIRADDPALLAGFLFPNAEFGRP
jgi:hypothetical protein